MSEKKMQSVDIFCSKGQIFNMTATAYNGLQQHRPLFNSQTEEQKGDSDHVIRSEFVNWGPKYWGPT